MPDLLPVKRGARAPARRESSWPLPRPDLYSSPFREFEDMWDRMVSRFFATPGWVEVAHDWAPVVDVEETQDAWIFEVELPGVSRDDVQVEVDDAELSISGEVKERERSGVVRHRARRAGSFQYRTTIPSGVDVDKVEARLDDGVLTVRVPRPPQSKARRIKID
jgi:HSP20 family protein